ncbi:MAG: hypothetical protein L0Z62_17135 [Gemmataceae bacterium]|nr:hypothetical protein [Gemmataceae bacterium]
MSRARGPLPALLLVLLAGCATDQATRPATSVRASPAPLVPDGIVMDVVLLERPAGDPYINQELWASTDEQPVPLEHKALLTDNGLRVGHLIGVTPSRLHELITSQRWCVSRWRQILPPGRPTTLSVSRPIPEFRCQLIHPRKTEDVALDQAQAFLVAVPFVNGDGRTRIKFTPQLQHGQEHQEFQPGPDGWSLVYRRHRRIFTDLGWEVTLAPNEYLVISTFLDNPHSLGHQCFVNQDDQPPMQRLLLIRTTCPAPDHPEETPDTPADASSSSSAPLALQANWVTMRGSRP